MDGRQGQESRRSRYEIGGRGRGMRPSEPHFGTDADLALV